MQSESYSCNLSAARDSDPSEFVAAESSVDADTRAVALNPTDWKHRDRLLPAGATLGCDFSGVVDSVGAEVVNVKVGDRVAGFVHGGRYAGVGSFAQYIKTEGSLVWKVPENVSFEEAAAMGGIGPHTAFQALYLRHTLPTISSAPTSPATSILIYGGSTSVGLYAIQMARLSGLNVITTCSPKNFDLVKSLGATDVYDYSDESNPAKIKAKYPGLALGFDCIAEKGSTAFLAKSLGNEGGKIVTLLPVQEADQGGVANVLVEPTLVYTLLGREFVAPGRGTMHAVPGDTVAVEKWLLYIPSIIASGQTKPNPILHHEGGLDAINDGLELLKSGKLSAQKITFTLA